jgi:enterochelin esterase-like enzyme
MTESEIPESPRLATLAGEIASGNGAIASFWREVEEAGTPLIEPVEGAEDEYLVTFLWRSADDLDNVAVLGPWLTMEITDHFMTRLPGSDVWYRSYRGKAALRGAYRLAPNHPRISLNDITPETMEQIVRTWLPDPLNQLILSSPRDPDTDQDFDLHSSLFELPGAPPQPWSVRPPGALEGAVDKHRFHSESLDNDRSVWVYTPPGYGAEAYPVVVVFDGWTYLTEMGTPITLDALIAGGRIPPSIAVLVCNVDMHSRGVEMPCNPAFADFLADELMPWVREHYHATADPARTVVAGSSYGGLASAFAGFHRSDTFGLILSQSGSYWWKPEGDVEAEWLTRQYAETERLPLRWYMDVGLLEVAPLNDSVTMVTTNRHLRTVLRAKGYPVYYTEFMGGHDYACWLGTLADGLIVLLGAEENGQIPVHASEKALEGAV